MGSTDLLARARRGIGAVYAVTLDPRIARDRLTPSALLIGAQRCGTSSLHHWLSQHPDVSPPKGKELHYFDLHYRWPWSWYRYHFARTSLTPASLTFESSPYYLFHPAVPGRVARCLPGARFVVVLRDPVARAYSHYRHERRQGRESLEFGAAVEAEAERLAGCNAYLESGPGVASENHRRYGYFARGCYVEQIRRWFDHFPESRFLFLESESVFEKPQVAMDRMTAFLGLPQYTGVVFPRRNAGNDAEAIDPALERRLRARFDAANEGLSTLTGEAFRWQRSG